MKPTRKQIEAGNRLVLELMDASVRKGMGGMGGCPSYDLKTLEFGEIVEAYLSGEIDHVTAVWMCMSETKEEEEVVP